MLRAEKARMVDTFGRIFMIVGSILLITILAADARLFKLSPKLIWVIAFFGLTFFIIALFLFIYCNTLKDTKEKKYNIISYILIIIWIFLLLILSFTNPSGILLYGIIIIAFLLLSLSLIFIVIADVIFERGKKNKIIKLHNMGYQLPEILKETDQNEEATNRYIKEYERVKKLNKKMMSVKEISHTLVMRKSLVLDYVKLIDEKS